MQAFRFSLDSVLKLRVVERASKQSALAQLLAQESELLLVRRNKLEARRQLLSEVRASLDRGGGLNVAAIAARQTAASALAADLATLDHQQRQLATLINDSRAELLSADQRVRSLEKLAEQQELAYRTAEEAAERIEQEQTWLARAAVQNSACLGVRG